MDESVVEQQAMLRGDKVVNASGKVDAHLRREPQLAQRCAIQRGHHNRFSALGLDHLGGVEQPRVERPQEPLVLRWGRELAVDGFWPIFKGVSTFIHQDLHTGT